MSFKSPLSAALTRKKRRVLQQAIAYFNEMSTLDESALRETFHALNLEHPKVFPLALAITQEAAFRALKLRPFTTQLLAASVLFDGVIAEMKTGEGKTLAIALAAAIASRTHRGVHIATPNAYLAARDCETMRPFYELLGLTVGVTLPGQGVRDKQLAYQCDILYGVHSELAFDYLRDNLILDKKNRVQRDLAFVIVDEVDSILIDEARTPLIISEQSEEQIDLVLIADGAVRELDKAAHVLIDEKEKTALLSDAGFERLASILAKRGVITEEQDLYKTDNLSLMRAVEAALRAHFIYQLDKDYVLKQSQVLIIDESTGRTLQDRRWQEGVHQAIEAKEKLPVRSETKTIAEITYQSYFGLYRHLSGLTGTALASRDEFLDVYGRKTLELPTYLPCIREDRPDILFANQEDKFKAIIDEVYHCHERGQPVLIGTGSVAESEAISRWLQWAQLPHQVLNARQNANEAQIITEAGLPGAITVATNMAGRGTDIVLGGHLKDSPDWQHKHDEVLKAGGLHVIGTQRHESRRIDDQLRGRSGRQGDPGSSQFFLSLEDDLIRIFGARQFENIGRVFGKEKGTGVSGAFLAKAIRKAQKALEERNFSAREQLFRFDGIIARQRDVVYALRTMLLDGQGAVDLMQEAFNAVAQELIESYSGDSAVQLAPIKTAFAALYHLDFEVTPLETENTSLLEAFKTSILQEASAAFKHRYLAPEDPLSKRFSRTLLSAIDEAWREHLTLLDALREGIHLRGMAQESPVHAFAIEAYKAFGAFTRQYQREAVLAITAAEAPAGRKGPRTGAKTARLSRCPCGSGSRYKHCHGRLAPNVLARKPIRTAMPFILNRLTFNKAI